MTYREVIGCTVLIIEGFPFGNPSKNRYVVILEIIIRVAVELSAEPGWPEQVSLSMPVLGSGFE